ncbi:MAG: dihydrofolate reductase [Ignavibacteriales bacterium]|nr:dihydrofolate reductase [Ignavibacteriales bacterium]
MCGGRNIYKAELDKADEMIISWMKFFAEGDTKFPEINFNNWEISGRKDYKEFEVVYYKSKKNLKFNFPKDKSISLFSTSRINF